MDVPGQVIKDGGTLVLGSRLLFGGHQWRKMYKSFAIFVNIAIPKRSKDLGRPHYSHYPWWNSLSKG